MYRPLLIAALPVVCAFGSMSAASAHAVCGSRVFPVTLTLDDPGVADEVTVPQATYTRVAADGGPGPGHDTNIAFEYDKRLTDDIGFAFNDDDSINQTDNAKTETGWDDVTVTAKWAKCVDPDDDFQLGFGVIREFGRTGTSHIGADEYGNTAPTVYFGKGLDESPVPMLQPLQFTGELSYALADKGLKSIDFTDPATGLASVRSNNGNANQWIGAVSVQYSIPYLQNTIKDFGLPEPIAHLVPLVELDWTSPGSSPSDSPTTWTAAPGVIYLRTWYQLGLEALIPLNKAAGTNVGFILQFHVFLDDLYPNSIVRRCCGFSAAISRTLSQEIRMKNTLLAALGLFVSTPFLAHAFLDGALPRVGSVIPTPPAEIVLTFTQGIEPAFSKLEVQDSAGVNVTDGAPHSEGDRPNSRCRSKNWRRASTPSSGM